MPNIVNGITFYSEEEGRERGHTKIKQDAARIALPYRKSETISA